MSGFIELTDHNEKAFFVDVKSIATVTNYHGGGSHISFKQPHQKGLMCIEEPKVVHVKIAKEKQEMEKYL